MESDRISTIEDWPSPMSIRDVQVLLAFTNFYRRFIRKFAKVTLPHTDLLKKTDKAGEPPKGKPRCRKSESCGKVKWKWTLQAELAFLKPKGTITQVAILQHFDQAKQIIIQPDVSGFAIGGILD